MKSLSLSGAHCVRIFIFMSRVLRRNDISAISLYMIIRVVPVRSFSEKSAPPWMHADRDKNLRGGIVREIWKIDSEKYAKRERVNGQLAALSVIVDIVLMVLMILSLFSQNPSTRIKMKFTILTLAAAFCLALVSSHPLPEDGLRSEVSTWAAHLSCLSLLTSPSILQRLIRGVNGHFSPALSLNYLTRLARGLVRN